MKLWDKVPVWYHLTFLLSLVPLSSLVGRIAAHADDRDIPRTLWPKAMMYTSARGFMQNLRTCTLLA